MKQYDGIKDEELISRFKNGESEILDYLMEKYKNMVRKKARTMFLIGGENDDLIQAEAPATEFLYFPQRTGCGK